MVRNERGTLVSVGYLLLGVALMTGMGYWLGHDARYEHSNVTFEQALEILRTSHDQELRGGARFALDNALRHALEVLRADPESKPLLDAWATLLR